MAGPVEAAVPAEGPDLPPWLRRGRPDKVMALSKAKGLAAGPEAEAEAEAKARAWPAVAAGAALVACTCATAAQLGGMTLGAGGAMGSVLGLGAGGTGYAATVAALAGGAPVSAVGAACLATLAVAGAVASRARPGRKVAATAAGDALGGAPEGSRSEPLLGSEPLLDVSEGSAMPPSPTKSEVRDRTMEEQTSRSEELEEEAAEETALVPFRDVYKGHKFMLWSQAQKRVRAWTGLLMLGGMSMEVDGEERLVRLEPPEWKRLFVGEDALELIGTALRLDGTDLVVHGAVEGRGHCSLHFQFDAADTAVEFALVIKTLRGHADSGAGIGSWQEALPDDIRRPAAAE